MTKQELNRDIKRLRKMAKEGKDYSNMDTCPKFKAEFLRLYRADSSFEWMNRNSILTMVRLNNKHRIVPFHQFGLMIKL